MQFKHIIHLFNENFAIILTQIVHLEIRMGIFGHYTLLCILRNERWSTQRSWDHGGERFWSGLTLALFVYLFICLARISLACSTVTFGPLAPRGQVQQSRRPQAPLTVKNTQQRNTSPASKQTNGKQQTHSVRAHSGYGLAGWAGVSGWDSNLFRDWIGQQTIRLK